MVGDRRAGGQPVNRGASASVTVTGAVAPLPATNSPVDAPSTLFVYVPSTVLAVTANVSVAVPPAGTEKLPVHVTSWPLTVGSDVVTPVVDPGM
jgi:hypothetical protein